MKEYILENVDETRAWARDFARTLNAPCVVALHGDLGMGKSEIARTVIQTLRGADTVVPSPTFTIVQSYDGISHFDLYRVEDASELTEIGLEHAMENDITLIEWPEIASDMLPENTVHVYIESNGDGRKIVVK
ncbi:MAG: tRNA (adenosine(37)-N6)-threonylcarbamoyltransferase complex ATPase subunit type 1 TsaE [Alphaproteobacteria bacterium]|nr:tRNA (adenosine(37)-N6)-threonylcarbamoyltransferase complex ATPase subunit type 1 TsaE [Alphaproteobacteria bacterium]